MQRRTVFDAVRRMLGRGFRRAEVAALDRAIDAALGSGSGEPPGRPHSIGTAGVALIKKFEGCARRRGDGMIEAYPDPGSGGDNWTIGWGATGPGIGAGTVWSQEQCDGRLMRDLDRFSADVARVIGSAPTSQQQFDALTSFHYNTGALGRSTLLRRHLAGDYTGAASEFARWKHAGGRVMAGLVRRRAAEARLYLASR
jgi:lysozyme